MQDVEELSLDEKVYLMNHMIAFPVKKEESG